jgi:hypothetical protein
MLKYFVFERTHSKLNYEWQRTSAASAGCFISRRMTHQIGSAEPVAQKLST